MEYFIVKAQHSLVYNILDDLWIPRVPIITAVLDYIDASIYEEIQDSN